MKKVLIIAPHQDDEVIGCAGLICYLKEKGYNIYIQHVFSGNSGVFGMSKKRCRSIRTKEAGAVADYLGVQLLPNMGYADRTYDFKGTLQRKLLFVIRRIKPDILLLPHKHESDLEHKIVSQIGREAAWLAFTDDGKNSRKQSKQNMKVIYYEVWTNLLDAKIYLDITEYLYVKKEALTLYRSQMKSGWIAAAMGRNAFHGTTLNHGGACEVFTFEKLEMKEMIG